jgi:hypothetical protein
LRTPAPENAVVPEVGPYEAEPPQADAGDPDPADLPIDSLLAEMPLPGTPQIEIEPPFEDVTTAATGLPLFVTLFPSMEWVLTGKSLQELVEPTVLLRGWPDLVGVPIGLVATETDTGGIRFQVAVDDQLDPQQWYALSVVPPSDSVDVTALDGVFLPMPDAALAVRFSLGSKPRVRRVEGSQAGGVLTVVFSERMYASKDPDFAVRQPDLGKELNCWDPVSAEHWQTYGSTEAVLWCDPVDRASPLEIEFDHRLVRKDGVLLAQGGASSWTLRIEPGEWQSKYGQWVAKPPLK